MIDYPADAATALATLADVLPPVAPSPRHAAPGVAPYLIPAHYLTSDTLDGARYPLALLLDAGGPAYADGVPGLPVAHGVRLDGVDTYGNGCDDCGSPNVAFRVQHPDGPDTPHCAECVVGGDHYGLVPSCYVAFVGVE